MKAVSRLDKEEHYTHMKRTREFTHRREPFFRINVLKYTIKNMVKIRDSNPV